MEEPIKLTTDYSYNSPSFNGLGVVLSIGEKTDNLVPFKPLVNSYNNNISTMNLPLSSGISKLPLPCVFGKRS